MCNFKFEFRTIKSDKQNFGHQDKPEFKNGELTNSMEESP